MQKLGNEMFRFATLVEAFIGNLPLTIGAVAMAVVTLGVVWFKFAEECLDTCEPVHFHSSQCTFPGESVSLENCHCFSQGSFVVLFF
jgi:hypothetical protein